MSAIKNAIASLSSIGARRRRGCGRHPRSNPFGVIGGDWICSQETGKWYYQIRNPGPSGGGGGGGGGGN